MVRARIPRRLGTGREVGNILIGRCQTMAATIEPHCDAALQQRRRDRASTATQ
jgi:hypothetical protein